jgi:predicted TIM-barrel fold metal-dependent hydrolase
MRTRIVIALAGLCVAAAALAQEFPNDADLLDLLESWLPAEDLREPLFAANAARLYRL